MSTSFVPKHDQPFTIQEAMNLEIETLVAGQFLLLPSPSLFRRSYPSHPVLPLTQWSIQEGTSLVLDSLR